MSDKGVVHGTRRRRSISESGHPRSNSRSSVSDLFLDEHDLVNTCNNVIQQSPANSDQVYVISSKLETLREKISAWQSITKHELSTIDSIKTDYNQMTGEWMDMACGLNSIASNANLRLS